MQKKFNDTGLCVPNRHYMVDISSKIERIMRLIEVGEYFAINRPRQFGKTTVLWRLADYLNRQGDYLVFNVSFEGIGDVPFASEESFCSALLDTIGQSLMFSRPELGEYFEQEARHIKSFKELSRWITQYVRALDKRAVLLIDEVDKSSDSQMFLHFLGMLRHKYLERNGGQDYTFQSVILAGVHDVKTLKLKIRPDAEHKYNSPWNIAVDFTVDLSFNPDEIGTMLREYQQEKQIDMEIPALAEKLYYYTSGYPYLVSKLCKFIDEAILPKRGGNEWTLADVDEAFKMITKESYSTTLFDSLAKNLENDPELYELVFQIVMNGKRFAFTSSNPVIHRAGLYGILAESEGMCAVHNRIFEQRIYAHMLSKAVMSQTINAFPSSEFFTEDGLNLPLILQKFQAFMKEHYSHKDQQFLEREGRLLFLAFLKPIINGKGFEFKEPNVAEERRMDIVITYGRQRYVIELKRWDGEKAHQKGLQQLSDYLDMYGLKEGYLLIYDFTQQKTYKQEQIAFRDKQVFAVWV